MGSESKDMQDPVASWLPAASTPTTVDQCFCTVDLTAVDP
ncbi:hypothetical protein FOMG_04393 [Fusarium oxysporum f. sp. melonis 26406]|uniref:Uncharacterized protein n=1 Tax=Fusarium oxysporum f. sp. melonis 26406 TaxID=1089452 RepID=X0AR21_FUSOX|nr:hypothetical protein FOMG_04393 [Fusarium oxysporum f. sp. melonis 26406]